MTFTAMDLVGQFILCKNRATVPQGWKIRQHGNWFLGSHPTLPVLTILGADSSQIGWLIGWPISPEGHLVKECVHFNVVSGNALATDRFESCLYEYGGRFAGVGLLGISQRFYLDPIGSLAAVYCSDQQAVASSPNVIPRSANTEEDLQIIQHMGLPDRNPSWCPFGTTPRKNVERLLPNHYVDLNAWRSFRHWPVGEIETTGDVVSSVEELISLLRGNISAIARQHSLYMSLTAGHDSRILLACAKDEVENIQFYTYRLPGPYRELYSLDRKVASRISSALKLRHELITLDALPDFRLEEWYNRVGGCVGGLAAWIPTVYARLQHDGVVLLGGAGELGRGFHWRNGDSESSAITPRDLLDRRQIQTSPYLEQRAADWLDRLPVKNALTTWGLLYNEEFDGCWLGPQYYGSDPTVLVICPFSHRRIIELLLALPKEYRRRNSLSADIIRMQWPELLRWPFNWPIGIRRYANAILRRIALTRTGFKT